MSKKKSFLTRLKYAMDNQPYPNSFGKPKRCPHCGVQYAGRGVDMNLRHVINGLGKGGTCSNIFPPLKEQMNNTLASYARVDAVKRRRRK